MKRESKENKMKLITLYLPESYIKALDQLVNERFYPNRAEAIRVAIRDMISAEVWRRHPQPEKEIFPVPKIGQPPNLRQVENNIQRQTYPTGRLRNFKGENYAVLKNQQCPHCGKKLRRSKKVWKGCYSWHCPTHGRVLPACSCCDKTHDELL